MKPIFFESIKVKDGIIYHWEMHQARMNHTMLQFFDLKNFFYGWKPIVESTFLYGLYKLKIIYSQEGIKELIYEPYQIREFKEYECIDQNELQYNYKFLDRSQFPAQKNPSCAPLYIKHGLVTDSLYYNLAFLLNDHWYTPKHPLFRGVKRSLLIDQGVLIEKTILKEEITSYEKISFINALTDLGEITLSIT